MNDPDYEAQLIVMPAVLSAIIEAMDTGTAEHAYRALERRRQVMIEGGRGSDLNNSTAEVYEGYLAKLKDATRGGVS